MLNIVVGKKLKLLVILVFSLCLQAELGMSTAMAASNEDWWKHAVFYQIYPRSFQDSNGDGVGDLRGIISRLDHLAESGITATWLSPIFQSPMVDFGYDISDFKAIHHEYGTMEDFDELITAADRLGIKIILDFVPNHTSNQCDWFLKSEAREEGYEDFYVWADGKVSAESGERMVPNNWQSLFYGPAWTWSEKRQQYYLHQFTVEQPDLNFRNPKVVAAMDDVLEFWLSKGVAGFRVDAVNHLYEDPALTDEPLSGRTADKDSYEFTEHIYTKDLPEVFDMLHHWRSLLDDFSATHDGPARIMMTEAYGEIKTLMNYYEDAAGVRGAHFPFNFHFITDLNEHSDARDFVFAVQKWLTYMPPSCGHVANWVIGNHDNPRVASRFGPASVDAMNMLTMTLPGVAVTYNGEEIGMQDYRNISWEETVDPPARNAGPANYKKVSRDPERTPFQWDATANAGFSTADKTWLPVHPNYVDLNLAQQKQAARSHYKVYKSLVVLRKLPTLRTGRLQIEALSRDVFAFKRELKGHPIILTIINIGATEQSVDLGDFVDSGKKLEVLVAATGSPYEEGHRLARNFTLDPFDALLLQMTTLSKAAMSEERRALIQTCLKSANVILVAMLMYKLWNNKWTKLNLNKYALE